MESNEYGSGHSDLLIVGAGIVGLAHAVEGLARGLRVTVLERDDRAVGASIRNFGHICLTAQTGRALDYGQAARQRWIDLAAQAGFWLRECGTVVVARTEDEFAVLEEFAHVRGGDQVRLLDRAEVAGRLPLLDPATVGGAWLPLDLRVDPRQAVPAIAGWLAGQGVRFRWGAQVQQVAGGEVISTVGRFTADRVIIAVGHDVDRLAPAAAAEVELRRCLLQMLEVSPDTPVPVEPAVLSGLSMLRYSGLAGCAAATAVRQRFQEQRPELLDHAVNLMYTQRPDGNLVIGDTHAYARTHLPFDDESTAELIIAEAGRLLGTDRLTVRRRWRGVYASSDHTDFLITDLDPATRVVSVTSGIGMTTAFGLAADALTT
ncbi:TIGR03364 family FAD-dependent oxidoreductase [Microlunatus sp. GCM10028923]|uniref:TIGR03364 family FAD-dependent oxidoreductase n=1 Tax=Microlunatus sp. GCM10028923 TaxID=3273400 RepID=UPI00360C6B23